MARWHLRRWRALALCSLAALAIVSALAMADQDPAPESFATPPPSTVATTFATATTTTTAPPTSTVNTGIADVATATLPEVEVFADPPAELTRSTQADVDGAARRATFAITSPERPTAPALPTLSEPIQGRHRTETGWRYGNPTPWGSPLTFSVIEDHGEWLKVQMPVRPNGLEGWIRAADVTRTQTPTRVLIDLSDRRLQAFVGDEVIADTPVVVGKASTRTPTGRSYITDIEDSPARGAYGPFVLALNVYSQDLDLFGGGVPVIAIHGTNRPDLLGSAASNGCVRIPNEVITTLRDRLPLGTPVDIQD